MKVQMGKPSLYLYNLGCRKNMQIGLQIGKYSEENNYNIIHDPRRADIIIINSCAFQKSSDEKTLAAIREAYSLRKPGVQVIVAGCMPFINPELLGQYHAGPSFDQKNVSEIERYIPPKNIKFGEIPLPKTVSPPGLLNRARTYYSKTHSIPKLLSYITSRLVQQAIKTHHYSSGFHDNQTYIVSTGQGCLNSCAFCSEVLLGGPLKSRNLDKIMGDFSVGLAKGYRKFVLVGDDTGAYGKDIGLSLAVLLKEITLHNEYFTLAISNLNPRWLIADFGRLMEFLTDRRIAAVNSPVQSGSNRILQLMDRKHTIEQYAGCIEQLQSRAPHISLENKVIVGFPTETEKEFLDTGRFLTEYPFARVEVFTFTERPNTPAANMFPKVPEEEKERRCAELKAMLHRQSIKKKIVGRRK